jgi:hypothetical protein
VASPRRLRRWAEISGHAPFTLPDLHEGERLALELLAAQSRRGTAPEELLLAARVRQQIFTLLVRTYERARRAVRYLQLSRGEALGCHRSTRGAEPEAW